MYENWVIMIKVHFNRELFGQTGNFGLIVYEYNELRNL